MPNEKGSSLSQGERDKVHINFRLEKMIEEKLVTSKFLYCLILALFLKNYIFTFRKLVCCFFFFSLTKEHMVNQRVGVSKCVHCH